MNTQVTLHQTLALEFQDPLTGAAGLKIGNL
jgi:hypothetical protein